MAIQSIRRVEKPWGHEEIWAQTAQYVAKVLVIREGKRLSLQFHRKKEETIRVETGELLLSLEDDSGAMVDHRMKPGDVAHILPGRKHRMTAVTGCRIYEASTPELDDVVRIQDDYARK